MIGACLGGLILFTVVYAVVAVLIWVMKVMFIGRK